MNGIEFRELKILTKIYYGKKQFVWEMDKLEKKNGDKAAKEGSNGENSNSNIIAPVTTEPESGNPFQKQKLEIKFNEIKSIDINKSTNSMTISEL